MGRCRGYSLAELIVVLTLVSLVGTNVLPSLIDIYRRNEAALAMLWVVRAVQFTRQSAISYNTLTTLCPSRNGNECGGQWHDGVLVFTDSNGNRKVDIEDRGLLFQRFPYDGSIAWRSFRNRQYLQITAGGYTNYQNGNFVYCSADQRPGFSRQVVINMQGRLRKSHDLDNDGIIEDPYGKPLRC